MSRCVSSSVTRLSGGLFRVSCATPPSDRSKSTRFSAVIRPHLERMRITIAGMTSLKLPATMSVRTRTNTVSARFMPAMSSTGPYPACGACR